MKVLGPRTWLRCLRGEREAILDMASSPAAFPAGILFVLSAGLAREYDGAYLLREPWHALLPLVLSAATGTLIWCAFFRPWRGGAPAWRSFLGLFWMSAPLAWLYGVPYERCLSPLDAYHANLATLALVSLWRVAWMTRVLAVLRGTRTFPTLAGVLFFADAVVVAASWLAPRRVVDFMGGMRGSPLEQAIGTTNENLLCLSAFAFPWLGVIALVTQAFRRVELGTPTESRDARPLRSFAIAGVLVWLPLVAWAQPEQVRRWAAERDLHAGRIREALRTMSAHEPEDYPPAWDPPPHRYLGEDEPEIDDVLEVILAEDVAPWVVERFAPKIFHVFYSEGGTAGSALASRLGHWAEREGEETARRLLEMLANHAGRLTPEQRSAVVALRQRVRDGHQLTPEPDPGDAPAPDEAGG